MLPDYAETKRLFGRFFQIYVLQRAQAISPLADVPVQYVHEGRGMSLMRADQSESSSGMHLISGRIAIKIEEVPELTLEKVLAKFDEMILYMVRQQTGLALEQLSKEIPADQSIDAKGKQLDADLFLRMLETIQLEFYPDGRPHELRFIGSLFSTDRLEAVKAELRNNSELRQRYEGLIARKKEEWRAREVDRELVG